VDEEEVEDMVEVDVSGESAKFVVSVGKGGTWLRLASM
jgi:hypothetical protein